MDQEKVKMIVKNMDLLVQALKEELEVSKPFSYPNPVYDDYDEIFED